MAADPGEGARPTRSDGGQASRPPAPPAPERPQRPLPPPPRGGPRRPWARRAPPTARSTLGPTARGPRRSYLPVRLPPPHLALLHHVVDDPHRQRLHARHRLDRDARRRRAPRAVHAELAVDARLQRAAERAVRQVAGLQHRLRPRLDALAQALVEALRGAGPRRGWGKETSSDAAAPARGSQVGEKPRHLETQPSPAPQNPRSPPPRRAPWRGSPGRGRSSWRRCGPC
jgi:hypothetical protein